MSNILTGTSYHRLDAQRRLVVPKNWREQVASPLVISRGLDGCLFIFGQEEWVRFTADSVSGPALVGKKMRDWWRLLFNDALTVNPDDLGRVTISENLVAIAALQQDVVLVGSGQYLELWDRGRYHAYLDGIGVTAEDLVESIVEGYASTSATL